MCDPVTLMALGTVTSTLGTLQQASAASANAKFQQQVSLDNAARTLEKEKDVRERGAAEEQRVRKEGAIVVANTRGALASNNMDLSFGSPLDTILQTTVAVDQDAYRVRRNTESEVRDVELERTNHLNSASASAAEASNATTGGIVAGVGTALGGAAKIYKYKASIS